MKILNKLTDQELIYLFKFNPDIHLIESIESHKVKRIVRAYVRTETGMDIIQDEAFGTYWQRKLENSDKKLEKCDFNMLVENIVFPTSKQMLGECAQKDKLSQDQCQILLGLLKEDDWAYKQAKARLCVEYVKSLNVLDQNDIIREEQERLDELLDLPVAWAVYELIPNISCKSLEDLSLKMQSKDYLSKRDRHQIRQEIKHILKNKKKM